MADADGLRVATPAVRTRRPPPPFRRVVVGALERLTPRMRRVTFTGDELAGLEVTQPASSVRLVVPSDPGGEMVIPDWTGNEFLLPHGRRPALRTFTPRHLRAGASPPELDVDIVLHGPGEISGWAEHAEVGDPAAISGTARGYDVDAGAAGFLLVGDETAIPAISQLLESIPPSLPVTVHVEVAVPEARLELPSHQHATVTWHDAVAGAPPGDAMVDAVRSAHIPEGWRVWAAGEAAAVQRVRRHLFDERGLSRRACTVRGYWKHGRAGDTGDD